MAYGGYSDDSYSSSDGAYRYVGQYSDDDWSDVDEYEYQYPEAYEDEDADDESELKENATYQSAEAPTAKRREFERYKPEISTARIQLIIREAMQEHAINKDDIPDEGVYDPPNYPSTSKRYFETKGFAWFTCPTKHYNPKLKCETTKRWPSARSWCFIDLKKQKICYRDFQQCNKCNLEASPGPEFTEEAIKRMASYAVKQYLIRIGKMEYTPRSTDTENTGGAPHDESRCGRCKRLKRSCWI